MYAESEINFLFSRNKFKKILSITLLNQTWEKFFQVGHNDLLKEENNGRYMKVWPANIPQIDENTLRRSLARSLEILDVHKTMAFTYITELENQEPISQLNVTLFEATNKVLSFPGKKMDSLDVVRKSVEATVLDRSSKKRISFLRNLRVSHPELFPDQIALLPKELQLQIEYRNNKLDQTLSEPDQKRGNRSFYQPGHYFNDDDNLHHIEQNDYNPNPDWYLDKTIDDLLEKERNNYEDLGSDHPVDFPEIELDDYLDIYAEDEFCPVRDAMLSRTKRRIRKLEDFMDPKQLKLSEQRIPTLFKNKPTQT